MAEVETFHEASPTEVMVLLPPAVSAWMETAKLIGLEPIFYVSDLHNTITHGMVTNRGKYFTFVLDFDNEGSLIMVPDQWKWVPSDPTV